MVNSSSYQNTKSIQTLISRQNFAEPRPLAREEFYIEGATFDLKPTRKQKKIYQKFKIFVFCFVLHEFITNYNFSKKFPSPPVSRHCFGMARYKQLFGLIGASVKV